MAPRKELTLTSDDLSLIANDVNAGKNRTVYLCDPVPSLNLPAGASARAISVDGNTVTVKPAGIKDVLPFEASELRMTKTTQPPSRPAAQTRKSTKTSPNGHAATPTTKPSKGVAVTIYVAADNTATVKVTPNAGKPAGDDVPLASVHKALSALGHAGAAQAIDDVLAAARQHTAERVAALQAELASAKKALAALERSQRHVR